MAKRTRPEPGSSRSSGRRRATGTRIQVPTFRGAHYRLLAIVLGVILAGFIAMAYESISLAPVLMVAGYCVGIPVILIWRGKVPGKGSANDRESRRP